jgi:hypothetical protein
VSQVGHEQDVTHPPDSTRLSSSGHGPDAPKQAQDAKNAEHLQNICRTDLPPDLQAVIEAWGGLPEDVRKRIAALAQDATKRE